MEGYLGEEVIDQEDTEEYAGFGKKHWAAEFIRNYGPIDGSHHKDWVLDQVMRVLLGTPVIVKIARWENGHYEYRFSTGEPSNAYLKMVEEEEAGGGDWPVGIPP